MAMASRSSRSRMKKGLEASGSSAHGGIVISPTMWMPSVPIRDAAHGAASSGGTPWRALVKSTWRRHGIRRPARARRPAARSRARPGSAEWMTSAWSAIRRAVPAWTLPTKCHRAGTAADFSARSFA